MVSASRSVSLNHHGVNTQTSTHVPDWCLNILTENDTLFGLLLTSCAGVRLTISQENHATINHIILASGAEWCQLKWSGGNVKWRGRTDSINSTAASLNPQLETRNQQKHVGVKTQSCAAGSNQTSVWEVQNISLWAVWTGIHKTIRTYLRLWCSLKINQTYTSLQIPAQSWLKSYEVCKTI